MTPTRPSPIAGTPDARRSPQLGADGLGCHAGKPRRMRRGRKAAGKSETLERYAADYPEGPARPAAEHVPGLRLAARRPAHAAHGDRALGLGLLRLRPDLHLALLRRAAHGRLRAVQLRDAGHRQAVRGHPRGGATSSPIRRSTTRSSSPISACRPRRGVPLQLLPKEINGVRIIGIDVPGFGVPTHAEAKDVLAGAMLRLCAHGGRAGAGAGAARRRERTARRSRCSARCSRPIRSASA